MTRTPRRVRLRRTRGWRKPDGVVVCARPSIYGNPFVGSDRPGQVENYRRWLESHPALVAEIRENLRGKDLACWCPLDEPCHVDVLLEVANG